MKRKIGIILTMIVLGLALLSGAVVVKADSNYLTTDNIPISAECTTGNCGGKIILGVRVALVGPNGDMVTARHIDYLPDNSWGSSVQTQYAVGDGMKLVDLTPGTNDYLQNVTFGTQIRQDVIRNGVSFTSGVDYWHEDYVKKMSSLVGHPIAISTDSVSKFANDLKTTMITDNSKITMLLQELHYSGTISDAIRDDLYFQIEPIVVTPRRNKGERKIWFFAGTMTELVYNGDNWVQDFYLGNNSCNSRIFIKSTDKRPTIFNGGHGLTTSGLCPSKGKVDDNYLKNVGGTANSIIGDAVGHLWISDLIGNGCENAAMYLNNGHIGEFDVIKNGAEFYQNGIRYRLSTSEADRLKLDGNTASCGIIPPPCGQPATTYTDTCVDGVSYYKDDGAGWLSCKIAYSQNGTYYSSENTGHVGVVDGTVVGSKDYCRIYCYEEVAAAFPTANDPFTQNPIVVRSGQTFGWGINGGRDGIFGTVEVKKHCSVSPNGGYKYTDWLNDYKANEKKLITAYLTVAAYEQIKNKPTKVTSSQTHCSGEGVSYNGTSGKCEKTVATDIAKSACEAPSIQGKWVKNTSGDLTLGSCIQSSNPGWSATAKKVESNGDDATVSSKFTKDSFILEDITVSVSATATETGSCKNDNDTCAEQKAVAALNAKIATAISEAGVSTYKSKEDELINEISKCVNNFAYQNGLTINFAFDEPVNRVYNTRPKLNNSNGYKLETEVISGSLNSSNTVGNTCDSEDVNRYSSGITATPEAIYNCEDRGITWDLAATIAYKYPAPEFTWFTLKTNGTLINQKTKEDNYDNVSPRVDDTYFYYVGYGLPTAITLTDGSYERLKVEVSKVGDQDPAANRIKTNNISTNDDTDNPKFDTHFESLFSETMSDNSLGFAYTCKYKVENDLFGYDCPDVADPNTNCDKDPTDGDSDGELKGVDVVYRVISLLDTNDPIRKAFPGRDATGRRIGSNWQGYGIEKVITDTDRANGVTTVDDKIHEILKSDVYTNSNAMYDIMLDVNTIQEIRKDTSDFVNDSNNRGENPYTTFKNVTCKSLSNDPNSSGYNVTYCASDFITDLINSGKLKGNCAINLDSGRRAEHILASGCDASYTPINPNWNR